MKNGMDGVVSGNELRRGLRREMRLKEEIAKKICEV
jgi:hypothetical protein